MKRRTTLQMMAAGVFAAPLLAACDGEAGGSGTPQALTVGMPNGPQTNNSNPFSPGSAGRNLGYRWLIYEPLAQVNQIAPDQPPTPWLATEWTWAPDFTSLSLTIRDGVKWSDGTPLTAEDVAFSFNLLKDVPALNEDAIPYESVKVNGNKVDITFGASQFTNQGRILHVMTVPKHIWEKIEDPTTETNENPIGSGPYTLKSWTAQAVTLVPNPAYWGGTPPVPEIRYTSYNDNNAQTTAITNSECQWTYVFIPSAQDVYVAKDPEHNHLWFPSGLGIHALWLNHERGAFKHVALRQAMNLVIDRSAINVQGHSGLYPLVDSPTGIPTPAGEPFISEKYKGVKQAVNVEQAKQILVSGGFTLDGDVLKDPDGEPVEFTLVDPAGWSDYLADLQLIADNVAQLGIKASVDTLTVDAWDEAMATGDFDASLHWTNTGGTPWDIYANIMDGEQYKPLGENASWNFGRYRNEDATRALSEYANAADEATRKAALDLLQDIFVEQVPAIPLVAGPIGAEYSTKFWTGWPSADDPYAMPQPTQASASMIVMRLKPAN